LYPPTLFFPENFSRHIIINKENHSAPCL